MPPSSILPSHEVMFLRSIKKTAVVLLLLLRLDRPVSAKEVSQILDMNYETTRIYFRHLSSANFVTKTNHGYILSQYGSQLVLVADSPPPETETLKNAEFPRFTINSSNSINSKDSILNTTTSITDLKNDISSSNSINRDTKKIWESLSKYGITRNTRTERLASQPFITPEYIQRHAEVLEESGKSLPQWAGLFITILEKGDQPPHKRFCFCEECRKEMSSQGIKF